MVVFSVIVVLNRETVYSNNCHAYDLLHLLLKEIRIIIIIITAIIIVVVFVIFDIYL